MTLHTDTTARFADLRERDLGAPRYPGSCGVVFTGTIVTMVALIVLVGGMLFDEITRCDPCEWVQFDAPMGGW